jgi:hypothetical protein
MPRFVNKIEMAESKQIVQTISFSLPSVNIIEEVKSLNITLTDNITNQIHSE